MMVGCDNDDGCDFGGGWFHLPCVGLKEVPPEDCKWYCPECRKLPGKPWVADVDAVGLVRPKPAAASKKRR